MTNKTKIVAALVCVVVIVSVFFIIKDYNAHQFDVDYTYDSQQQTLTFTPKSGLTFNRYEMKLYKILQLVPNTNYTFKIVGEGLDYIDFYLVDEKGNERKSSFEFVSSKTGAASTALSRVNFQGRVTERYLLD